MRWFTAVLAALLILMAVSGPTAAQEAPDPADEFRAFFASFRETIETGDRNHILALFDIDRLWSEVRTTLGTTEIPPEQKRLLVGGIRLRLGGRFATNAKMYIWEHLTIERVKLREEGREAVVVTRIRDKDGFVSRARWWLVRGEESWRIFDMENQGLGLRLSTSMSSALGEALQDNDSLGSIRNLMAAMMAMMEGDYEEADRVLDMIPNVELPSRFEALKLLMLALLDTWNGNPEKALSRFDAAANANPQMSIVDLGRAEALLDLERGDDALTCIRRYLLEYGEDPEGRIYEGLALAMLNRPEEAIESLRKALTEAPDLLEALVALAGALPEGKKQEVADWFRRQADPAESFWDLFEWLVVEEEREAGVAVLSAFREMAPENPLCDMAEGWLHANAERYEEAADCYRRALPRVVDPEERETLRDSYLEATVRAGKPVEGYLTFPGSSRAFREICGLLASEYDGKSILQVAKAHAEEVPDDLWLQFYRGRGRQLTGDHDGAEKAYATGMARAADDETREEFRFARVLNLYDAGKGLSAYGKVGPRRATFRNLAENFSWDEDAESLAALVGAHVEADAKDPAIRLYRGEILWILGELEGMVGLLDGLQGTLSAEPDLLVLYEDRLVRGLARLGRGADALKVAKRSTERDANPWFEAVVHAITGDVEETGIVLDALVESGSLAEDFWSDEDLARALETNEFNELRTRYPKPE